jgi:hypothetical protein
MRAGGRSPGGRPEVDVPPVFLQEEIALVTNGGGGGNRTRPQAAYGPDTAPPRSSKPVLPSEPKTLEGPVGGDQNEPVRQRVHRGGQIEVAHQFRSRNQADPLIAADRLRRRCVATAAITAGSSQPKVGSGTSTR